MAGSVGERFPFGGRTVEVVSGPLALDGWLVALSQLSDSEMPLVDGAVTVVIQPRRVLSSAAPSPNDVVEGSLV